MKIVLFGTPQCAVDVFQEFLAEKHSVELVVTQPSKRSSRKSSLLPPPMQQFAQLNGIKCIQPKKASDQLLCDLLQEIAPDLGLVFAYGGFIPSKILQIPKHGFINLHPSLLPRYRGAAPINWAILNGDKVTGLTTFFLIKEMDAGDILLQREMKLFENETAVEFYKRMVSPGFEILRDSVNLLEKPNIMAKKQDSSLATYAPKLTKEMGKIDWSLKAEEIFNKWRALQPWPGCYSSINIKGIMKKIHFVKLRLNERRSLQAGKMFFENDALFVSAKDFLLNVDEIYIEGKKTVSGVSFYNGYQKNFSSEIVLS